MAANFSYIDSVTVSDQYTTLNLCASTVNRNLVLSNMSIVPQSGAASDVTVKIIRGALTIIILEESLAAGDKLYDSTIRYFKPTDELKVECTNPIDLFINGSWY
jgi:hypothetical protein